MKPAFAATPWLGLDLAVTRIVTCAVVLLSSEVRDAAFWAASAGRMLAPPPGLVWALPFIRTSDAWVSAVQGGAIVATSLALLGWRTRWTLPLATVAVGVLYALPHFSGIPRHSMHLVWFLAVLAVAPCGVCLRLSWFNEPLAPTANARISNDVALGVLRALLGAVYFFPGFWKLRESGLDWIFSDNLMNQMHWKWYQMDALPSWRPDRYPWLVELGALGVVLFELSFPLLLWRRSTRLALAGAGFLFHSAAAAWLFLPFGALTACYTVLIDWRTLAQWLYDESSPSGSETGSEAERPGRSLASRAGEWWSALRGGHHTGLRRLTLVSAMLLAGVGVTGYRGIVQAYPFACYPTFQYRAEAAMPDLWLRVLHKSESRWLPDSPAHHGTRTQPQWGMAWRVAGVYGETPSVERLHTYFEILPQSVRGFVEPGDRVQFFATLVNVDPDHWKDAPLRSALLEDWTIGATSELH